MKVLFLDVDGVLNAKTTFEANKDNKHTVYLLDPIMVELMQEIIRETDVKVVLSSTWRGDALGREMIDEHVCKIYDITPRLGSIRGEEIAAWLKENQVTDYVIVDDDADMLPNQKRHLFQTTWEFGLTRHTTDAIIAYLNKGKGK